MNEAAILTSPNSPLTLQALPIPTPSAHELLIKVSLIGINAIEAKIAKRGTPPPPSYPFIPGSSYTGTIVAIGSSVTKYQVGDRVLVSKRFSTQENAYGAYQRYVLVAAGEEMVARIPEGMNKDEAAALVALIMNASCVAGLFSGRLGLRKPGDEVQEGEEREKTLIYGGSSSFGRLAVQYLRCAGYDVITTSSPQHMGTVRTLSGSRSHVVDHTLPPDQIIVELIAKGPYSVVVDMISTPQTIPLASRILASQGGGKLFATQPMFSPERLPEGVERVFEPWSDSLYEEGNEGLMEWVVGTYLPFGMEKGWMSAQEVEMVKGLESVDGVLGRMVEGYGAGKRFVVELGR
ncbi:uncharacterized protein J4E84_008016 [Alternaria hordeiaustralica]|uniref:uncharacterized protein n=1 Tax=Alternaria hordeiaustralica TaxID=1187925 RepID=UPI0020C324A9|nr:uncharacterized protein J4E84_008016 [Alternaria hordeiaustralica]KAI4680368.1 hypothetical protein J4E84_008016 [Alternaria hordeiaustralica]